MTEEKRIELKGEPAITAHVEMMQGIISRLADNSAKCKEWCFAFVGVVIIFLVSSDNISGNLMFWPAYAIVIMFYLLDSYYLGLERRNRDSYERFIESLNELVHIEGDQRQAQEGTGDADVDNADSTNVMTFSKKIFLPGLNYSEPRKCIFNGKELRGILYGMTSPSTWIPYLILIILMAAIHIFYPEYSTDTQCACTSVVNIGM